MNPLRHGQRLRRLALRDVLVISQLSLSLVLLVCAVLFVRSLRHAVHADPGFAAANLVRASMETRAPALIDNKPRHFTSRRSNALAVFRVCSQ